MCTAYMNEKFKNYRNLWNERIAKGVEKFLQGAPLSDCISRVSLALSNMCNYADIHRKCPASEVSVKEIMKRKNIENIVLQLKNLNFKGVISFHIYNEPSIDPRLFDIIKYIKKNLTDVEIYLYSNGFYLNQDMISELEELVDVMTVTAYGKQELERIKQFVDTTMGFHVFLGNLDDRLTQYDCESKGIINNQPCRTFFNQIDIFPNGDIGLCCLDHKHSFGLGNVFDGTQTFQEIIDSPKLRQFQTDLLRGDRNHISPLCRNCTWIQ